jgi:hypothetical protein
MTGQDCHDLGRFLEDPRYRRSWLLIKASHGEPLDRALDLAKRCDDFITATDGQGCVVPTVLPGNVGASEKDEHQPQASQELSPPPDEPTASKAAGSLLSTPQRERLLGRLAEGAKNAELAAELGLSPKQVQGIRMGCAREIRRRRERREIEREASNVATIAASIDDVVRYLRQQDDVVVPQEGGDFLVNARFRLPLPELVSRANRMRARQRKPEFELEGARQTQPRSANGHPHSWRDTAAVAFDRRSIAS